MQVEWVALPQTLGYALTPRFPALPHAAPRPRRYVPHVASLYPYHKLRGGYALPAATLLLRSERSEQRRSQRESSPTPELVTGRK